MASGNGEALTAETASQFVPIETFQVIDGDIS